MTTRVDPRRLVDAYTLAAFLEVTPDVIRQWARRGHITRYGTHHHRGGKGLALYDPREVARHASGNRRSRRVTMGASAAMPETG